MLLTVQRSQVMFHEGKFITEASTIGIPPGTDYPQWIAVVDPAGEGFLFLRSGWMRRNDTEGDHDFLGYTYRTVNTGIEMVVFND